MANKRIQDLTEETIISADNDFIPVAKDIGGGNYTPHKVKRKNILRIAELAERTSLSPDDVFMCETGNPPVLKRVKHSNIVRQMFMQTTPNAGVTGTSEQTLIGTGVGTLVVPANFLAIQGRGLLLEANGFLGTPLSAGTLRVRLRIGAQLNQDLTIPLTGDQDGDVFILRIMAIRRNNAGSPALRTFFKMDIQNPSGATDGSSKSWFQGFFGSTDETIDQTIDLTAQFSIGTCSIGLETLVITQLVP